MNSGFRPLTRAELEFRIARFPRDLHAQNELGILHYREKEYARALGLYERLVGLRPESTGLKVNCALSLLRLRQYARARAYLQDALRTDAHHGRIWGYLGIAHEGCGDFDLAEYAYERQGLAACSRRAVRKRFGGAQTRTPEAGVRGLEAAMLTAPLAAARTLSPSLTPVPSARIRTPISTPAPVSSPVVEESSTSSIQPTSLTIPPPPSSIPAPPRVPSPVILDVNGLYADGFAPRVSQSARPAPTTPAPFTRMNAPLDESGSRKPKASVLAMTVAACLAICAAAMFALAPTEQKTEGRSAAVGAAATSASTGSLLTPPAVSGRTVFVDGVGSGIGGAPLSVRCGPHKVRIADGHEHDVNVPCGGEVTIVP